MPLRNELDARRMYKYVTDLASFGPRNPGAPGDQESLSYLQRFAADEGLQSTTLPCRAMGFRAIEAGIDVLSHERSPIECLPQDGSCSTPDEGIVAEVVYTGCGHDADYEGKDVRGKIVIEDIWGLHMLQKIEIAEQHGALGCIFVHAHPGGKRSAWGLGVRPSPIPVVCVSREDGMWMREHAPNGLRIRLKCRTENPPVECHHLLYNVPGTTPGAGTIVVMGHRDTTHVSPGANDNASGMAVMMEIACALRKNPVPMDFVSLFTTVEEGGGLGIAQVAKRLKESWTPPVFVIDLDMLSVGSRLLVVQGDQELRTSPRINRVLMESARTLGYYLGEYEIPMGLADAGPLIREGIEATWLFMPDDPWFHTSDDTIERVDPNDLKAAADIVARAVVMLSQGAKEVPQ